MAFAQRPRFAGATIMMQVIAMLKLRCQGFDTASRNSAATAPVPVAMALEGGGFRALTADLGLVAGLLSFIGQERQDPFPTLNGTELLGRFGIFSSVSGSSWFFSSLAYSSEFASLVERIAASPGNGSALFERSWLNPLLQVTNVSQREFDATRDRAQRITNLLTVADEDTLYTLQFILATNGTWNEYVKLLLSSTASIQRDMTLADPVNAWAKGKVWFIDHTVLLPTAGAKGRLYQGLLGLPKVTYVAESAASIPLMVPAKFSMILGNRSKDSAPYPYMANTAVSSLQAFGYNGDVIPIIDEHKAKSGPLGPDLAEGALTRTPGNLPIWGVVSASSAAVGSAAVLANLAEAEALIHADMTPWVSTATDGASFTKAQELVHALGSVFDVNQKSVEDLASHAIHGVIDGGFSDGTGISHAVAAGSDEVLAILNSNATQHAFYLELLCKEGPPPLNRGEPAELFPVFETSAATVRSAFNRFHKLFLPPDTKFLKAFAVGTILMTTADNKYFGISGGRSVRLHAVSISSSLNIGLFENLKNYGLFLQEVVQAITAIENSVFVGSTLLPMVMGSSGTELVV